MIFKVLHLILILGASSCLTRSTNATQTRNSARSANSAHVESARSANSTHSANSTQSANIKHSANSTYNENSTRNANSTHSANSTQSANIKHSANSTYNENSTRNANSTRSAYSTNSTYSKQITSVGIESFSKLLLLTDDICGYVDWCTVRTQPQSWMMIGRCCKRCSCARDCARTRSCCPDHKLSEYLNGSVFTNTSLFQSFLHQNAHFIDNVIHNNTTVETLQKEKTAIVCAQAQLKYAHPNRPPGSAYFMVTSCLNVSVDPSARFMCESEYNLMYEEDYQWKLLDVVPVQSQKTGIIYRNRHCHKCSSERQAPFVVWDVLIATFSNHGTVYGLATSFEEFISHSLSERYFQLFFEPSHSLRESLSPQVCQKVDVRTCDNRDGFQDSVTEAACQRYELPVYSMVDGNTKAYNNLACVYCGDTSALEGCQYFYKWGQSSQNYVPFIGALATEAYEGLLHPNIETHSGASDNRLNKVFSTNCATGFVYDNVLVSIYIQS